MQTQYWDRSKQLTDDDMMYTVTEHPDITAAMKRNILNMPLSWRHLSEE